MNTVAQILKAKGKTVWTVPKEARVSDALKLFSEHHIGAVVVMDGNELVGIFTERDFAHKMSEGESCVQHRIEDLMTKEVITVDPHQSVRVCMALMTDHRIRHLPVVDGKKLVGIISIGDVVKDMIEELQFMVDQMEKYIQGLR